MPPDPVTAPAAIAGPPADAEAAALPGMGRKLLYACLAAGAVLAGAAWYAGLSRLIASLGQWNWRLLPLVLGAVLLGFTLRFFRWQYFLRTAAIGPVAAGPSAAIFLSGFAFSVTPGKVGEVVKSVLLRRFAAVPVSRSAPVVFVERVTDVIAMAVLASFGVATYGLGLWALVSTLLLVLASVLVLQQRGLIEGLLSRLGRIERLARPAAWAGHLYASTFQLLRWPVLLASSLVATAAWFCEAVALYLVAGGFGQPPAAGLFHQSVFIYSATTLFGAVSFLPGGLGATEGAMAALLQRLSGLGADRAVAATLLLRFATLWFGTALGALSLAWFQISYGAPAHKSRTP